MNGKSRKPKFCDCCGIGFTALEKHLRTVGSTINRTVPFRFLVFIYDPYNIRTFYIQLWLSEWTNNNLLTLHVGKSRIRIKWQFQLPPLSILHRVWPREKQVSWRNNGLMVCFRRTTKRRFQSKAWKFGEFWSLISGLPISSLTHLSLFHYSLKS